MSKKNGSAEIYVSTATLVLSLLFLASCSQIKTPTIDTTYEPVKTAVEVVVEESSSVLIPTFYDLSQISDIVIIGQVLSDVGVINTARNPKDNSKPDPRFFTVASVYEVEVEEYLIGEGPDIIYLVQWEGDIYHGKTPSPEEIEQARLAAENKIYTSIRTNIEYLMFLRSIEVWEDFNIAELEQGNLFIRTANPWLFDATDQRSVFVVDTLNDIGKIFPPQPLADIIKLMNSPQMVPVSTPYPAPVENPIYQSEPTKSSYPAP